MRLEIRRPVGRPTPSSPFASSRLSRLSGLSFRWACRRSAGHPGQRGRQSRRHLPVACIVMTVAAGLLTGDVTGSASPAFAGPTYAGPASAGAGSAGAGPAGPGSAGPAFVGRSTGPGSAGELWAASNQAVATSSAPAPAPVVGSTSPNVSLTQIETAIDDLYTAHPGIASFEVQDVGYTPQSSDVVLKACTAAQGRSPSQADETARLLACAPLVFFLFSYGREKSVPEAVRVANELYYYAISHTNGPSSPVMVLGGVLRTWGLPVSGSPVPYSSVNSPAETALVDGAKRAILAAGSVHLLALGYQPNSKQAVEKIVADVGTSSASESLAQGEATASIRVTPKAAYFSGNNAGLTTLMGLSSSAAKKAGPHWVTMKKGTSEYKTFSTEETIGSVPATVLPASGTSVKFSTSESGGRPVKVLTWQATASGSNNHLSETLVMSAAAAPLPVTEVTRVGGDHETVSFSGWGEKVSVPGPPAAAVIPYSALT